MGTLIIHPVSGENDAYGDFYDETETFWQNCDFYDEIETFGRMHAPLVCSPVYLK